MFVVLVFWCFPYLTDLDLSLLSSVYLQRCFRHEEMVLQTPAGGCMLIK